MTSKIHYLSTNELDHLSLSTQEVVDRIENLLVRQSQKQAWNAPKSVITPPDGRYMMATLSASDDPPFLATKSLILNPDNPKQGLPIINSLVTLLDSRTGIPLAIIDGNWITAIRTAGLTAVAAKYLARNDSSIAAFVGCGVQAHSHLRVLSESFPLKAIRAYNRSPKSRDAFCRAAETMELTAIACEIPRETIKDADIVVTSVTISPQLKPFLDANWLKPGVFVSMVDLAASWLPETMNAFDQIVIDDLEQESSMEKPLVNPALVSGDLFGLVNGKTAGRKNIDDKTAFAFRGLAIGDLALAGLAYQRFRKG